MKYDRFIKVSKVQFKEEMIFTGKINSKIAGVLMFAENTGTWTFAYVTRDKRVCVVGFGKGGKRDPKIPKQ